MAALATGKFEMYSDHWWWAWLPTACLCCGRPVTAALDICPGCRERLPLARTVCECCGSGLAVTSRRCGFCLNRRDWSFDRCVPLMHYREVAISLITGLKYRNDLAAGRSLSLMLVELLRRRYRAATWPQVIIPVPLHRWRYLRRGFNQSEQIAAVLARELGIDLDRRSCRRYRATPSQTALQQAARRRNMRRAFRCDSLPWEHVALVDDVVTSGATVMALAQVLRRQRPKLQLDLWCLARA